MKTVAHPAAAAALTTSQMAAWLSKSVAPGCNFNCAEAVDIFGEADLVLLLTAMQTVADETESARVRLLDTGYQPRQIIERYFSGELPYLDFSREREPEAAAEAWMHADFSRPIDPLRERPWLSALLRTTRNRYIWYHRSHRILLDGFDGGLMAHRLAAVYSALVKKDAVPETLPPPSIAQLLHEESAYLVSKSYAQDKQYWMERLTDAPAPLTLAALQPAAGAGMLRQTVHFPAAGVNALQDLARKLEISLPQLLTAVTSAFLYRTTGVTDMVVGVATKAARVLPLRLALSAELSIEQLMRDVGRQMRKILQHQSYPCETLRDELHGLPAASCLFSTVIKVESYHSNLQFGSHPARLRKLFAGGAEDLTIAIHERGAGQDLQIDFDANPALHSAQMLAEHQRRLLTFLAAATHSPAQKIGQLELSDATGRKHLPANRNDAEPAAADSNLARLIEEQLARNEQAATLHFDGEPLPRRSAENTPN
ncbi:nonribosomal peptide synthetase DhbF [Collimonas sp. PA-H2]|uniref:condensation domain-containing protein n=1 Tax=Collimonas sp. PA-H2 TaxID=1881062 RepID=UPI000C010FEC|nr:condensation domain-containing protein [Collimonas sp. PA-H2]PFH07689.1 nonribosomal peptide synthetase DhbF [Collimonas sp. PA-H2]